MEVVRSGLEIRRLHAKLKRPAHPPGTEAKALKPTRRGKICAVPGVPGIATLALSRAEKRRGEIQAAEKLAEAMRRWPSKRAMVTLLPGKNQSTLLVAGPQNYAERAEMTGAYEVVRRLANSEFIKECAKAFPQTYSVARPVGTNGEVLAIRLPGSQSFRSLTRVLQEGGGLNRMDLLRALVEGLPKGKRVALLVGGPSAAGKSTLIREIEKLAGNRRVVPFPGDMYFRDADDTGLPKTPSGLPFWDHPEAMHMEELTEDLARLLREGKAFIPVYNFKDVRPGGWRIPGVTTTGYREDRREPLELGEDDILVIDSIHATSAAITARLENLNLPYVSLYLDSPTPETRLLRRILRDYESRSRSAEKTLEDWDETTFRGEIRFVRPTILQLDPARDLFLTMRFDADLDLSRPEIDRRVQRLAYFGLPPTREAFRVADRDLPRFASLEIKKYEEIVASPQAGDTEKEKARSALSRIRSAPGYGEISTSAPHSG